jgi:UrcA family protein
MKAILTAAWAAVLFVTSLPAAATQPDWDQRSVKVDYSDLDLTKAHGVSALQHRVTGAIRQVCDNGGGFSLQEKMQQRACAKQAGSKAAIGVDQAIAAARQKMDWAKSSGTTAVSRADKGFLSSNQQPGIAREPLPKR